MRNFYLAIILESIINTFDIKPIDSLGYWPYKDFICANNHHLSSRSEFKVICF